MEGGVAHHGSRTAEEVFGDFKRRRIGLINALTIDVEKFYQQCDPEKDNLCLYGHPNETWEVNLPAEEVPPELPEPALGINFARDGMDEKDWLALVAVHSDAWLLAVAFYFAARFGFDKESRGRLFSLINHLPTIYEVVTGIEKRESKEKTLNSSSRNAKPVAKPKVESHLRPSKMAAPKDDDVDDDDSRGDDAGAPEENDNALCGQCNTGGSSDEFWICCDICERWYHGRCVKISPSKAEHIKKYKCPECSGSNKRTRN